MVLPVFLLTSTILSYMIISECRSTRKWQYMSELKFHSSLTMEEIEENFKNVNLFDEIINGLNEALKYAKKSKELEKISNDDD